MKCVAATILMCALVASSAAQERSSGVVPGVLAVNASDPSLRSEDHYPLEHGGGIAVSSADLPTYLANLQERAAARSFLLLFPDLLFAPGSMQIEVIVQTELARMAGFLRTHPDTTARIIGHTDDRGDTASNMQLAEARATAVYRRLIDLGIDAARLSMTSRGETSPAGDNQTSDGRDSNRRVRIVVQKPATR